MRGKYWEVFVPMAFKKSLRRLTLNLLIILILLMLSIPQAMAREVDYVGQEVEVYVNPREPTKIEFLDKVASGFKPSQSALSVQRDGSDLIVFARSNLSPAGEAVIVKLADGRSYSLRMKPAIDGPRDSSVKILDSRTSILGDESEEEDSDRSKEKIYPRAPSNTVSGLMRDMTLVAEFGKKGITGFRASDRYRGQTVLNDGTLHAVLDQIFIGPDLWGYVLDVKNLLDTSQRLNPATFRLDGTRAISIQRFELAPRPLNVEQQVANKHQTKVYVVTRSRSGS